MDTDDDNSAEIGGDGKGQALALTTSRAERTIVVNGREHRFAGDEIGRDELTRLAFPGLGPAVGGALTVAYDHGPADAPSGLVVPGRTTRVLDGQTFSVSQTDKS